MEWNSLLSMISLHAEWFDCVQAAFHLLVLVLTVLAAELLAISGQHHAILQLAVRKIC